MAIRTSLLIMLIVAGILALVACQEQATPAEEGAAAAAEGESRLALVKERGNLICAANNSLPGFGAIDANGNTVGFDIELCRAVAAAVLGNANAVEFRPTVAAERGPTMQSGEVDMMSRNTTWTTSRNAQWGNFAPTMFYDGQGLHGSQVSRRFGLGRTEGREGMRAAGHDNRAEPARLRQPEQHGL